MHADDFETLAALLKKRSGLSLTEDKSYLLESRLMPVVRRLRYTELSALVADIRTKSDESLLAEVTEVMTTNESFFFRDTRPFDQFREVVLPALKESRASKKRIRIWSAACSSGQEPYSLAILIKEMGAEYAGWTFEIVGTDISEAILSKARAGIYSQFEVQRGLPIQLLMKYFTQVEGGWELSESVRSMVQYRSFNLLDGMSALGVFDVVYCRNVLIYFDQPTKADVMSRVRKQMTDYGSLYLGGAETVLGICDEFKPVPGQRGMYCIVDATAQRAAS
jgi:chemotaxis protein methyltransferase CheR